MGKKKKRKGGASAAHRRHLLEQAAMKQAEGRSKERRKGKKGKGGWVSDDAVVATQLRPLNLRMREVRADGNCLFAALSDQMDDDGGSNYETVRMECVNYIASHDEEFQPFITDETVEHYCGRMCRDKVWGGNLEVVAAARRFGVTIVVHMAGQPRWVVDGDNGESPRVLQVAYLDGQHYTSVVPVYGTESVGVDVLLAGGVEEDKKKEEEEEEEEEQTEEPPPPMQHTDLNEMTRQERRRFIREEKKRKKMEAESRKAERARERMGLASSVETETEAAPQTTTDSLAGDMGALFI